jgi:hypothetical protein
MQARNAAQRFSLLACALIAAVIASIAAAQHKGAIVKKNPVELQKLDIKDESGTVRLQVHISGEQVRFFDEKGRPLRVDARSAASLPDLPIVKKPDSKADDLSQQSIGILQGQVDVLFTRLAEVTQRVNELSRGR